MVHIAYDVKELLKSLPVKIDSVAAWGSRLLIGCIDGSLRIYKTNNQNEDHLLQDEGSSKQHSSGPVIQKTDTFSLEKTLIGFSKKPIISMTVVPSRNLLITLSDAIVVHRFPGFEVVAYLSSSKGSSLYAWDEKSGLLCSVKQRRLIIFQYDGRQGFIESKELTAPDNVTSIAWFGDSLCLGIRREYVIINTNTNVVVDLFPCGQIAPPSVVSLPNGELLLGKDNVSVIVGQNAKLSHSGGLSWSEVPSGVLANPPYALAWLSRCIEVRHLQPPFSLVQMIPLREMQLLPKGNHVIAAGEHVIISSDHSIYALLMVPLGAQIVQLAASRSFDEALMLCKLLPPEDAALRASKEDDIHKRYGQFLFEQKEYARSMEQFAVSSIDLLTVLSLFPSIRLPNFCAEDVDGKRLQLPSFENESPDPYEDVYGEWGGEGFTNKELEMEKDKVAAMSALASFLMGKRNTIVAKADAEETNATVAEMVNSASSAGESTKASRSLAKLNNSPGTDHERIYTPKELATILDTALLQAQLFSKQFVAAYELLSGLNYCDVASCEEMMIQGSHYKELLQLYKYNELHRKVLDLLNKLAMEIENVDNTEVASNQAGPDEIIKYFKKLGGQDPFLILDSAIWLLKTYPEEAINAFISMDPPLPTDIVNNYLKDKYPELQIMYLEQLMLNTDKVKFKATLQNELVDLYLQKVLEERTKMLEDGSWDEHTYSDIRKKLLDVLEDCTGYSCENALMRLPANSLHEERAILLGKLGQHQLALTLYAQKLHEPELALKYCDKVFQANAANKMSGNNTYDKSALNIYLILLQVYLKPTSAIREYDRSVASLDFSRKFPSQRRGSAPKTKGHVARKIAQIEGWDDGRQSISSESTAESGKSDGEDNWIQSNEGAALERVNQETEKVMLDEALDLLSCRWDRIDVGHALSLLPGDTKLQRLYPFLEPLVRKSSETRRNLAVIKNLRQSENLQVKEELQQCRRHVVKISNENTCSICRKKIGASVFAVYPDQTLVHFVCYKDQRVNGAVGKSIRTH